MRSKAEHDVAELEEKSGERFWQVACHGPGLREKKQDRFRSVSGLGLINVFNVH